MYWLMKDIAEEYRTYQRRVRTCRSVTEAITRCKNTAGSYVVDQSHKLMFHNQKPDMPLHVKDVHINTMRTA